MSTILPSWENSAQIQKLWADFIDIIGDLKLDFHTNDEVMHFKGKTGDWFFGFELISHLFHVHFRIYNSEPILLPH